MAYRSSVESLQTRVSDVLRRVPGASALIVFGSCATPDADEYSDIDLRLVVADPVPARAAWLRMLEEVGRVEIAWSLSADGLGYTILFADETPYHKLDVSLVASDDAARQQALVDGAILWAQEPTPGQIEVDAAFSGYTLHHGSVGHVLFGELMSAVRYVKARKRGHHLVCWRFARSKLDLLLALLVQQERGWNGEATTLTTWEYKALDRRAEGGTAWVYDLLDWSTPMGMDRGMWETTTRIADLLRAKANACGEVIPPTPVGRYLAFVEAELFGA